MHGSTSAIVVSTLTHQLIVLEQQTEHTVFEQA